MKTILLAIDGPGLTIAALTTGAIFLFIAVLVIRWVLQIPVMIKLLKHQAANSAAQKRMIELMAEKQGISTEELNKINEAVKAEFFG